MDIQMIKTDVVKSSNAMNDIADALAKFDFAGPLEDLGSAMPGGQSAGGAKSLSAEWKRDQDSWVKAARDHQKASMQDANHIEATDVGAAEEGRRQTSTVSASAGLNLENKLGPI
ncbi:hypothetical protein [Nocardioides sp. NPDC047086]|uniref:hypothetical protein n=1 Tax=Nocardioides sp. NPDC047086 TaxID=3154810 RepID=UPI0033F69B71